MCHQFQWLTSKSTETDSPMSGWVVERSRYNLHNAKSVLSPILRIQRLASPRKRTNKNHGPLVAVMSCTLAVFMKRRENESDLLRSPAGAECSRNAGLHIRKKRVRITKDRSKNQSSHSMYIHASSIHY